MAQKRSTSDLMLKWKKKKWFPVKCKEIFGEQIIGEVLSEEVQQLIGRTLTLNLMTLTGDPRKQTYNLKFKITSTEGNSAIAMIVGMNMLEAMVKKLVRKRRSKIDDSFLIKTSDNRLLRCKPLIVTVSKVSNSVKSELRKLTRYLIYDYAKKTTYVDFVNDIIKEKLQNELKKPLNKITAIETFKIRVFKLLENPTNRDHVLFSKFESEVNNYTPKVSLKSNTQESQ
ncbi:MAG: hypothetical protein QW524_00360 [Candidatus Woesearchaeota archaeon]